MAIKPILTDTEVVGKGASHRMNIKAINDNFSELSGGGGGGPTTVSWDDIEDKPAVVASGETAAEARSSIGAGTSDLVIGTTATTAKAGNYVPDWADVEGKPAVIAAGANQAAARTAIGAGTSSLAIGATATTAAAGNHTHPDATTTAAGFMTSTMVTKLNGIAASANNYTLPASTATVRGGALRGAAVEDATNDPEDLVTKFNALLASLRAAGLIEV